VTWTGTLHARRRGRPVALQVQSARQDVGATQARGRDCPPSRRNAAARSDPLDGAGDERMSSSPRCAAKRPGRFLSVATKNSDACDQSVGKLYRRQWGSSIEMGVLPLGSFQGSERPVPAHADVHHDALKRRSLGRHLPQGMGNKEGSFAAFALRTCHSSTGHKEPRFSTMKFERQT